MIDLDRLVAMQKKCDATFQHEQVGAFLDVASIRADYFRALLAEAPALLEALVLARDAVRLKPFMLDKYGECVFCVAEGAGHEDGCLWGKIAALLGKE